MEFGKLLNIQNVDWTLPPEDPLTQPFLAAQAVSGLPQDTHFYIGTPAWAHKEWIGKIYPERTKAADFLAHYALNFNTIELNTSHYRIPTLEQTTKWLSQVGPDFLFCPKIFNHISHSENGLLDRQMLKEWFVFLQNLKQHLGPCFLQLPPHFDYARKAVLFHFLQQWPDEFPLAIEFRHPSWFADGKLLPALTKYLQSRNIGLVITDVAGRRDVLHSSIAANFTMLRFIGNNLDSSDFHRAHQWSLRLRDWRTQGLKKIFFFVHEPDDISAPEMAQYVIQDLNETCQAKLSSLRWCKSADALTLDSWLPGEGL